MMLKSHETLALMVLMWHTSFSFDPSSPGHLLPTSLLPLQYRLYLAFDINKERNFPYIGLLEIYLKIINETDKIVLHAQGFRVEDEKITLKGQTGPPTITQVSMGIDTSFLTIKLDRNLEPKAAYTLTIPFYGYLKRNADGIYVSSYFDADTKQTEYIIATKFKPSSARKGFPCFDEPTYKTALYLNLCYSKGYTSIANMPKEIYKGKNIFVETKKTTELLHLNSSIYTCCKFQNSVPMSTYLYAFVVHREYYLNFLKNKTPFKVWVRDEALKQTEYATFIAAQLQSYYADLFNVSYKLVQHDIVALPVHVDSCMESWGLIVCNEAALFYDRNLASPFEEKIANAIGHALVHQWFGNLVTIKRWSDLWFFEAFATYFASIGTAVVESSLIKETDAIVVDILMQDSVQALSPFVVEGLKNVSNVCDLNFHNMGIWLVRMMHLTLGQKVFLEAIQKFLVKYSYSNAEQDDLWRELTLVGQHYAVLSPNVSVKTIMDTWTKQTGYPLITVNRNYDDGSLTIRQQIFQSNEKEWRKSSWWLPITSLSQGENATEKSTVNWLYHKDNTRVGRMYRENVSAKQWILFNLDMLGPFRINYDERNWGMLIDTLNSPQYEEVPLLSRVQLLSDSFALIWINQLDFNIAIDLVCYLKYETHFLPILTAMTALNKIDSVLKRSAEYGGFQKFVQGLISPSYKMRLQETTATDKPSIKVMTSQQACYMKVPKCEETAEEVFRRWMSEHSPDINNPVPAEQRAVVYCVGARRGSVNEWTFLRQRRLNTQEPYEKKILLAAMTCSRDVWILKMLLEWTIEDGSEVDRQDSGMVISSIMRSQVGYYIAKEFLMERIQDFHRAFSGQLEVVGDMVKVMLEQFTSDKELKEFLKWRSANSAYLSDLELELAQGLQEAEDNIAWLKQNKRDLIKKILRHQVL